MTITALRVRAPRTRAERSVVHVSAHYPPYVGGVENAVAAMAAALGETHARVEVLTSAVAAPGAPARAVENGVRVRRYRFRHLGNTPLFPGLVVGLLRQPRGTVVHAHGPHAFVAEVSRVVCAVRGLPLVLHVHLEVGRSTRLGVLLPIYRRLVVAPTLRAADAVVALTPDLADALIERYDLDPARVLVVPNAVDPAVSAVGAARASDPAPSAATERSRMRVLYLGRLVAQKRVSRLIEAVARCAEPVELVVVGEGELRADLERQAAAAGLSVRFPGAVDRAGVAQWLAWADVFVLPSEREGMPLSVLEAMAAGVPVLATDVEGTRELVADHGLLVERTPEALADGLDRLARDPDLRQQLARRGLARAARDSWTTIAATLTEEYDALSSAPSSAPSSQPAAPSRPRAARGWRRLDSTDASWARITYTRSIWGIDAPGIERMRAAVATVLAASRTLARDIDIDALTWRPLTAAELAERPARVVLSGAAYATPEEADRATFELPLEDLPFRVVLGPNYICLRATHAFGDEWTAVTTLNHLLRQAGSDVPLDLPWQEVSPMRRRLLTVQQLGTRPRAVLTALRKRSQLSGGPFEPAALNADRLRFVCTYVRSPEGFLTDLRAQRKARGLDVSLAAVTLTGLRRSIGAHLTTPMPGAEVVYDVRRESPASTDGLGNWVAGVYVVPEDDDDPVSVGRAMAEVRDQGLSLVAAAATRRRKKTGPAAEREVFAAAAGLRLTLSYIPGYGPLRDVPFVAEDAAYFGTNPPNGTNTLTLTCAEVGDRMHFGILHYDSVWRPEQVRAAVEDFMADPWGEQQPAPARRAV